MRAIVLAAFSGIFAVIAVAVFALDVTGSSQATQSVRYTYAEVETIAALAERELVGRNVDVAIVFRTGRLRKDMPDGVLYTHGAFWVRETDAAGKVSYAVHNLYQGEGRLSNTSGLYQDDPQMFVRGTIVSDFGIIVPSAALQAKLKQFIGSPAYAALHNPSYSIVSNPHNDQFQNCNEFMLDVMVSLIHETDDYSQIKRLAEQRFEPQHVTMGPIIDRLAPLLIQDVSAQDHAGPIHTATYRTLGTYLENEGYLAEMFEWHFDKPAGTSAKPA